MPLPTEADCTKGQVVIDPISNGHHEAGMPAASYGHPSEDQVAPLLEGLPEPLSAATPDVPSSSSPTSKTKIASTSFKQRLKEAAIASGLGGLLGSGRAGSSAGASPSPSRQHSGRSDGGPGDADGLRQGSAAASQAGGSSRGSSTDSRDADGSRLRSKTLTSLFGRDRRVTRGGAVAPLPPRPPGLPKGGSLSAAAAMSMLHQAAAVEALPRSLRACASSPAGSAPLSRANSSQGGPSLLGSRAGSSAASSSWAAAAAAALAPNSSDLSALTSRLREDIAQAVAEIDARIAAEGPSATLDGWG